MNKTISAFIAIAAMAAFSAQAATVEPTVAVGVAHVTGNGNMSPYGEAGLKASNKTFAGTVGLGSLKTPDHNYGTINYGAVSASYKVAPEFAVGAGSFIRVVNGEYTYVPFVQATGTVGAYDAVVRVATKTGQNVTSVGIARKF